MAALRTYLIICFSLLGSCLLNAQDKIIFRNGKVSHGKIITLSEKYLIYTDTANPLRTIQKDLSTIALIEKADSNIFLFSDNSLKPRKQWENEPDSTMERWRNTEANLGNNLVGLQPFNWIWGRITINYERLILDKRIGLMLPLSLTFDPYPKSNSIIQQSAFRNNLRNSTNWIYGADINFYFTSRPFQKFFVGPRFRYGTDILTGVSGSTFQFQFGWMKGSKKQRLMHHTSMGFGILKTVNIISLNDHFFSWFSVNYRISWRTGKGNPVSKVKTAYRQP